MNGKGDEDCPVVDQIRDRTVMPVRSVVKRMVVKVVTSTVEDHAWRRCVTSTVEETSMALVLPCCR